MLRKLDSLAGAVRTGACDYRHAPPGLLNTPLHHLAVLVMGERGTLAGRAGRYETVGAFRDLPIDQAPKSLLVHGAIAERGDERGERASEARLDCHDTMSSDGLDAALRRRPLLHCYRERSSVESPLRVGLPPFCRGRG